MKAKHMVLCFMLIMGITVSIHAQNFKIVFVTYPNYGVGSNTTWLNTIATKWGATGVGIRVLWSLTKPSQGGGYDWTILDNAINTITSQTFNGKKLDIYIRIAMGHKPAWVSPGATFLNEDFQTKSDGTIYDHKDYCDPPCDDFPTQLRYPLNFTSFRSTDAMKTFFIAVLDHINARFPDSVKSRIKEVVPSFSSDEESEYPNQKMCGYSYVEMNSFRTYLAAKYSNDINKLKQQWGNNPNFPISNWPSINPRNYGWDNTTTSSNYVYPKGRTDWMNFRTESLSIFLKSLKTIATSKGFKMGIQLGSIYDASVEMRGWTDPSKLIDSVNSVRVADVFQYENNFNFAADYLRSICKFAAATNTILNDKVKFSTETNWPAFMDTTDDFLCTAWATQLRSYYRKGATEHFITGWGRTDIDSLENFYSRWRDSLAKYSTYNIKTIVNQTAVHMGCEQILFKHNPGDSNNRFEIYNSIVSQGDYASHGGNYDGNKDIVTNYMIERSPSYINYPNYYMLWFTKSSEYITDKAYVNLMKSSITIPYGNATWFTHDGHGEFAFTHGLYNEYGEKRSPIHLIWRSRDDLRAIWETANIPKPGSGHTEDFVTWAYSIGCGYSNHPTAREYPGWEIRDNGATGNYKYDKNIRAVWNANPSSIQTKYPGGHYRSSSFPSDSINMISWAKGNSGSYPALAGYNNWPYIGDGRTTYKDSASEEHANNLLDQYSLSEAYPNPFNPTTVIRYQLPNDGFVSLKIYDILGNEITELVNEVKSAGTYNAEFNASNLASGVYIYRIQVNSANGGFIAVKKMMLTK